MIIVAPPASDLINASATATNASLISVPAGRWYSANVQLSAVQSGVGTAAPNVTWTGTGTGYGPANGTLARITIGGLLGIISSGSDTTEILVYGGDNGGTIGFNASGTSSSVTINGTLI